MEEQSPGFHHFLTFIFPCSYFSQHDVCLLAAFEHPLLNISHCPHLSLTLALSQQLANQAVRTGDAEEVKRLQSERDSIRQRQQQLVEDVTRLKAENARWDICFS